MKKLLVLITGAILLAGCGSMSPTVDGQTHVYTLKKKCPSLMEMDVGQVIELTLAENPSTGYGWKVNSEHQLFEIQETYQQGKSNQKNVVGSGGERVFRFTAKKPGEELIDVKHVRAWEGKPVDEWTCRVRIS